MLSTLLGTHPPVLTVRRLVRACELFAISSGAARTAVSRLVAAGDLEAVANDRAGEPRYRLSSRHARRQSRQDVARTGRLLEWNGRWHMALVVGPARDRGSRAELRRAAASLRMAEVRDGVWVRPDNLPWDADAQDHRIVSEQCRWLDVAGGSDGLDAMVDELWPLGSWATIASELRRELHSIRARIDADADSQRDRSALAEGFVVSADVLRHLVADPLLPAELLDRRWPGAMLRRDYDAFDIRYRDALAAWLAS